MTTKRLTVTIGVLALGVVVGGLAIFLCRDKAGSTVADSPDAVAVAVENDTFPQVYGIDVSYYQGNIFWDKLWLPCSENGVVSGRVPVPEKLRAVQFAFIRATMGDTLADLFYYKNYQEAKRAGIPCGSYHFLTDGVSGKTQAEWFLAHARLEPGDLPPVLDMEMKSPAMVQRAKEWLEVVEKECGTQAIIYTNMNLYSMFVKTDTMLSNRTPAYQSPYLQCSERPLYLHSPSTLLRNIKNADVNELTSIRNVCEEFLTNKNLNQMYVQFDLDPLNLI